MRLSIAIAAEKASPSAFVVWRGFEKAFEKASAYGFHGVELALRNAEEFRIENIAQLLRRNHLTVSCISTGQVFAAEGLSFTNPSAEIRQKTISVFRDLIHVAADWGGLVNIGRARGSIAPGQRREDVEQLFLDELGSLLPEAERLGVDLIIEPINRYESNFINTVDEAAQLAARTGSDRVGVMPDVFHMNIEDDDICASLERNSKRVRYIHLADSNRNYPGCGHLDFRSILTTLQKIHFDGWCSVEILPKPDPDTAAKGAADALLAIDKTELGKVWA